MMNSLHILPASLENWKEEELNKLKVHHLKKKLVFYTIEVASILTWTVIDARSHPNVSCLFQIDFNDTPLWNVHNQLLAKHSRRRSSYVALKKKLCHNI
jgi:hypothetical protein